MQRPLKSLKLGSPGTGKNKKPLCVCVCVYVILCLRSYLYLLKPFSISRKCESSPRLLEITSCTDYTVLGLLLTELVFALTTALNPVIIPKCSAKLKILHTLICLGLARRCERPTRSHCPIRRLLLSHHPCVIPASRYAHNASHS